MPTRRHLLARLAISLAAIAVTACSAGASAGTVKTEQEPTVGDYVMFCDVPGHRQMGQQGIVHVVDAATLATAAG